MGRSFCLSSCSYIHFHSSSTIAYMDYLFVLQKFLSISAVVYVVMKYVRYLIDWGNATVQKHSDHENSPSRVAEEAADGSLAIGDEPLIVSFGEMLIDFVPDVAGISLADSLGFLKAPGGAPANVAVAIAKLGGRSAFIGKLGDDEFGRMLVDILRKNEVNDEGVCFDTDARTALAFVTLKSNGTPEFLFYRNPSADMLLQESELNLDLIRQAKIFHYGSISLISEPCRSAHLAAMQAARQAGLLLSYDPNVRLPLWPSPAAAREGIMSIWTEADFIKVSVDEVAFLTNGDPQDEETVLSLCFDGLKLLVVTDGEKGCRYFTKDFGGKVGGFSVKTVDTTGAGDAFVGSLLVSLARDDTLYQDERKLREALTMANACGALATTRKGAIPALTDTSSAMELIAKSK